MRGQRMFLHFLAAVLACGIAAPVFAAEPGQGPGQGGGRGGNRGQMDPAEMQKRMEEFRQRASARMREQLGVKDDAEWKVIETRMNAVQEAQRNTRGGDFGGMMGRGMRGDRGGRGQGGDRPEAQQSEVSKKMAALRAVLENEKAEATEIKKALEEYRGARKKAEEDLAKARASLREVLTQKQEAQLVMMGTLD